MTTALEIAENYSYAQDYSEPGYELPSGKKGILFGNWNDLSQEDGDALEAEGFELEWYDEWTTCDDCGKAVRTQPDSYMWTPYQVFLGDGTLCGDCVKSSPDDYVEYLTNNVNVAMTIPVNLEAFGFEEESEKYQDGWFEGMNDKPQLKPGYDVIFVIEEVSQFYTTWKRWIRAIETKEED